MFKLTWFDTEHDVNAEVNNGRGPVDFKVSKGKKNANMVEFKLAKNTGLEKYSPHQVNIYEKASEANASIKVIMYFSATALERVMTFLRQIALVNRSDIAMIDASPKASASKTEES